MKLNKLKNSQDIYIDNVRQTINYRLHENVICSYILSIDGSLYTVLSENHFQY